MLFKPGEARLLWPFYLSYFIKGLSMVMNPFIVLYFLGLGLTYFQISIIIAVYGITALIFEIPTSAFADGFSRKYSTLIGFILIAITSFLMPLSGNFYLILVLHIISSIGMTFTSGVEEAWAIDTLNNNGRSDLNQEYFIKGGSSIALGALLAPAIGALFVKLYSIKVLWLVSATGYLINAAIIVAYGKSSCSEKRTFSFDIVKKSYRYSRLGLAFSFRHRVLFLSLLAGIFTQLMFCGSIGNQKYLLSLGMAEDQLGYMYSVAAAVGLISSFFSRSLSKFKPKNIMSVVTLVVALLLISLYFIPPPFFLIACTVFILKDGMMKLGAPVYQAYIHNYIPGKIRASTLSVDSMLSQFVFAVSSMVASRFLDAYGPQKVISLTGFFGILAIIVYQKIKD